MRVFYPALCLRRVTALWMMLLLLPPLALGSPTQQEGQAEVRKLEADKPVERELAGGQSHTYEVALTAGQYIKVVVEQRGIDVVVTLIGPSGKQIIDFDGEIRRQGVEVVSLVAETEGKYRLHVQSRQKDKASGHYEIRILELRVAAESDHTLQEARKLSAESRKLSNMGKYDEASSLGERVLEVYEKVLGPDHPDVAYTLNHLGNIYDDKNDYVKAEPLFQRALAIWEKAFGPDHPDVARPLNNLALLYSHKGDYVKAEPLYQRALIIWEKALGPDHFLVGTATDNLAGLYLTSVLS